MCHPTRSSRSACPSALHPVTDRNCKTARVVWPAVRLFATTLAVCLAAAGSFVAYAKGEPDRRLAALEREVRIEPLDVVFQDLGCGVRCDLIRQITASPYTHMGIVLEQNGERMVWEAYGPVGPTPLADWVARTGGIVAVYRFDEAMRASSAEIAREVQNMRGLPYDGEYQWDDDRIYCSELIAKAVKRATGTTLSAPRTFSFGAERDTVARMTKGRLTEATQIVAPVDLARSPHLKKIAGEL